MTEHPDPEQEAALAAALADVHRRQAAGERVEPERYREALGPLVGELEELLAVEGALDRSMERERTPALPRVFGRYTFVAELGRGGMGTVFLADDRKLGRRVAVKVLHAGFAHADERLRQRFLAEARLCGTIRDEHIVAVHDADEHEGELYYVMDVVPGESLAARLKRGERPDPRELAVGLRDVARALEKVHAASIVHRDVKPGNILITPEGRYLLTDFGLARRLQDARLTRTGQLVGTLPYMSPGQLRGTPDAATPATDVYGLGAVLYEGLTGRLPFGEGDGEAMMTRILRERPPAPRSLDPSVPQGLEDIALRALEKRPGDRHGSARELADELDLWLAGGRPRSPRSWGARVLRAGRENALAVASAALLLLGVGLLAAQWWARRPGEVLLLAPYDKDLLAEVSVLVDDRDVGRAGEEPLRLTLPPGLYRFAAQAPGFGLRVDAWDVRPGSTSKLRLDLGAVEDEGRVEAWRTWLRAYRAQPVSGPRSTSLAPPPPVALLAPRGDVRRADLATGWCVALAQEAAGGTLTLQRGAEALWEGSPWEAQARPGEDRCVAWGRFPAPVLARLRVGDELELVWTPAGGQASGVERARAKVVLAPEAEDAQRRIARLLDPAQELGGRLGVESLLGHGLSSAALFAALEHVRRFPKQEAAWTLLKAVLGRLDARTFVLDDIDAHRMHDYPAPSLPAAPGLR